VYTLILPITFMGDECITAAVEVNICMK